VIRAAGGLLWRDRPDGPRVALVHRPRYDDWSLPKGKLDDGEGSLAAAVREVAEETGAAVAVSRRLPSARYQVAGTAKVVDYWAMRHRAGEFVASREVDRLRWLPVAAARERLSYSHDRAVLDAFAAAPAPDAVVVLVRHARAGKRSAWRGDDRARPLDELGLRQAEELARFLALFAPDRVLSADLTRCAQTVQPLARRLGQPVRTAEQFADERYWIDPAGAMRALRALAIPGASVVVCSQGVTIPALIAAMRPDADPATRKGSCWVLAFGSGALISADHYPPPGEPASRG